MKPLSIERRKLFGYCVAALIALALCFLPLLSVKGYTQVLAESASRAFAPPSKEQTQTVYHLFEDPVALGADDNCLYALDGANIKRFALSDFAVSDYSPFSDNKTQNVNPAAFSVRGETAVTVENGQVFLYDLDGRTLLDTFGTDCRGVFLDETHIYAQISDTEIVRSSRTENDTKTFTSAYKIKTFGVLGGDIYFARSHGSARRDDISYFTAQDETETAVENLPEIIALCASGNSLAVLDNKGMTLYERGIAELIGYASVPTDTDALAMTASGEDIFVLDANKAVTRYKNSLSEKVCVLASASDEPGFFSSPSDVITRKNRTYVADRNNDRIVVHDGEKYSAIGDGLFRPIAVASNHTGNIYAAYSENRIAVFDASFARLGSPADEKISVTTADGGPYPEKVAIADIKCDLKGTLYLLSKSGAVFTKPANKDSFSPLVNAENVSLIDVSPNSAYVYIAVNETDGKKTVKRINGDLIESTGITLPNIKDIAVDADNSIYVLENGDRISRYGREENLTYVLGEQHVITDCLTLSKITVSNVSNDVLGYRDLIVTEADGHRIRTVPCADFGVEIGDVTTPPKANENPVPVNLSKPIIRTVINPAGAEVYAQSSEVTLLRTLPYGYKVIVPDYDEDGAFSLIFADNVILGSSDYDKDRIISGYVHNEFLSDPLPYTDEHETECSAWISSVPVYKYPSRQAPKIDESADKGTSFHFLDFVYEEENGVKNYGYTDNFPDSETLLNNRRWYRVLLKKDNVEYEGFVVASTVSVLAGNPDMSIRPQVNAEIIAKDKNVPTAGATVYKKTESGETVADNRFEPLPVGTKVEVIGAFDSSEPYTQIAFFTPNGTVTAFVETANIKYHGVNVVRIVAVVLIIITVALIIFLCARSYVIKRNKINKVDENKFDKDSEF